MCVFVAPFISVLSSLSHSLMFLKFCALKFILLNYEVDVHVYIYVKYLLCKVLFILLKDHYI